MATITSRFTEEELYDLALSVVDYNNEIADMSEVRLFTTSLSRAFYTEGGENLFLMEIEDGSGKKLIEIDKEQLKAMFVLYENIADAVKLETE